MRRRDLHGHRFFGTPCLAMRRAIHSAPRHAEGTGVVSVEPVVSPGDDLYMSENNAVPRVLYTMEEAAEMLRVSRMYLYRMRQRGDLVAVRFGRRIFVEATEIDRVIAAARAA